MGSVVLLRRWASPLITGPNPMHCSTSSVALLWQYLQSACFAAFRSLSPQLRFFVQVYVMHFCLY